MFERVSAGDALFLGPHQIGGQELLNALFDRAAVEEPTRTKYRQIELATENRSQLGDPLSERQAIEPRHQRVLQRCGYRYLGARGLGRLGADLGLQDALGQLFDE